MNARSPHRPRVPHRKARKWRRKPDGSATSRIYSFFVWLIFFKFKWLPWNTVSQVVVITLPIVGSPP
jgi:hypothetical protein